MWLLPACGLLDTVEARASAGGPLSKPIVSAKVTLHKEWTLVWGETFTYRLDIEIDGQKYRSEDVGSASAVSISPDRKTFAVRDREAGTWQLYSPGTDEFAPGVLTLVQEGDPLEKLEWPAGALKPVPDYSWLQWVALAAFLAGIGVGVSRWKKKRAEANAR
jgi:hypothetical protein